MYKVISLLGPPGSGKGTQSSKIIKELGYSYCSIGDALREKSKVDEEIRLMMKTGELLPIEIIEEVFVEMLKKTKPPYLLDGVPRNADQIKMVENALSKVGLELDLAIFLEIEDSKVISRLSNRWLCLEGTDKKLLSGKSKEDVSHLCQGEIIKREDDEPEVVKKRLQVYHKETSIVVDHYRNLGSLFTINADDTIDNVFNRIREKIVS